MTRDDAVTEQGKAGDVSERGAETSDGHPTPRPARFRIFSSAPDATRSRRPTDGLLLVLAVLGVVVLSFSAPGPTAIDTAITNLVAELPDLAGWFWEVAYDLLIVWSLVLLLLAFFARGRKRLFLYQVMAGAIGLGFAILGGSVSGTDPSTSLSGLINSTSPSIYLATRVAVATAVIVATSPDLARPMRLIGRWLIAIGALSGIALGASLPIGIAAGFLIGFGSAALVHLLFGSPGGRLTLDQVTGVLGELGVEATATREAALQPRGVALTLASTSEGDPLLVKVFGRDAWDGQLVAATWYAIWHRGAKRVRAGRLEQVEHEAFLTLAAERGGVPVMSVVAAGETDQGDAVLVLDASARSLSSLDASEVGDELLRDTWKVLGGLHELGISHGQVDARTLLVRPEGTAALTDLGDARVAAPASELRTDRAQLLVTTALAADTDRAVSAAADVVGNDGLVEILPFLQPAAFEFDTRKALHDQHVDLKELRQLIAERTSSEIPPLEPLQRVTWKSLLQLAVVGFLAYTLISAFANIGIDTILEQFKSAEWTWLLAASILSPLSQVPQAFSSMGATLHEVRFWPVLMLQYTIQFVSLAVPSSAGRLALQVRFWERVGVPGAGAVSIGVVDSFSTFVIQILLIVLILASDVVSLNLSSGRAGSSSGSSGIDWGSVLIAIVLVVAALGIGLLLPKTREKLQRFLNTLREKWAEAKEALQVLRRPKKLLLLLGGNLIAQVLLAIILGLCLRAFGYSASLAELILINTFVSLFAGFMPVPGGVGVAEAGFTAGLIAVGIPEGPATSTALAFRLVTFYLPPLWGVIAMRWMKSQSYL
ncbi:MAG: lysylphosphatidylglycerol synthase transmembrane domain-containing protein [Actinomycetota bacterium]